MNVHPLFVHFPIALFTLYSLFELIRLRVLQNKPYWFFVKAVLVICGAFASYAALFTGGIAEDIVLSPATARLIETHSTFATITAIMYSVLALLYLVTWIKQTPVKAWLVKNSLGAKVWSGVEYSVQLFFRPWILVALALVGLVAVTITGSLGGAIVYGPEIDPAVSFIYHLFVR